MVSRADQSAGIKHNVLNANSTPTKQASLRRLWLSSGGHYRYQHGGSWYRYYVGRRQLASGNRCAEAPTEEQIAQIKADWQVRHDAVLAAGGLHIVAPSAMNPAVSTTSCVAVPVAGAIRFFPFLPVDGRCADAYFSPPIVSPV